MTPLNPKDFRLDWDRLKMFYYIARLGNITRAAEFLHFSQSALSKSLKILEDRLKTRLFYRETGGLRLTDSGEALFKIVEKCYLEIQQVNLLLNEDDNLQGKLKVAISAEISSFCLVPYLSGFFKKYPDLCIVVEETSYIPIFDTYEADVLICPFIKERKELNQHLITTFIYGLYASKTYIEQFGTPQTLEDLNEHQLLNSKYTADLFPEIVLLELMEAKQAMKPSIQINSMSTRVQLALQGLGIIAVPKEHFTIKQAELVSILPNIATSKLDIYYIYSKQFESLKHIKVLEEYLKIKLNE